MRDLSDQSLAIIFCLGLQELRFFFPGMTVGPAAKVYSSPLSVTETTSPEVLNTVAIIRPPFLVPLRSILLCRLLNNY